MIRRVSLGLLLLGLFSLLSGAQSAQDPGVSSPPSQPTAGTQENKGGEKKPKKVWTNESVGTLSGPISVVGDATQDKPTGKSGSAETKKNGTPANVLHSAAVRKYRDEIAQLKTQIGLAEARITQMKNFKADNAAPAGGLDPSKGYTMLPPEEQIKLLEEKKKKLQAKIDDLELQAEKEGIDPGELR